VQKMILVLLGAALMLSSCCGSAPESEAANEPLSTDVIALTHVHIIPMTSEEVLLNQTLLVRMGRILLYGPAEEITIPAGAQVIEGAGGYLLPGLADMHMHTRQDWLSERWPVSPFKLYLANGVTTIRDMGPTGDDLSYALDWRDAIAAGEMLGPRLITSGELLFASPLEDPAGVVHANHAQGFDFLKLYSYLSLGDFRQALQAAEGLGMYSTGHVPYPVGLETALDLGMDEIAHVEELLPELIQFERYQNMAWQDWMPYIIDQAYAQLTLGPRFSPQDFWDEHGDRIQRIVRLLQAHQAPVCTTLVIDHAIAKKLGDLGSFLEKPELRYLPQDYHEALRQGDEKHLVQFRGIEALALDKLAIDECLLRELHAGGVKLVLGTDSGTGGMGIVPGFSVHDELQILAENGFSPYEALQTATVNAAGIVEAMVGQGDFGVIDVGKRADLILVKDNPLEHLQTVRTPIGVMKAGHWFPHEQLQAMIALNP